MIWTEDLRMCPRCGHISTLDGFDVAGADGANLFCTQCHLEDEMVDVVTPEPDVVVPASGAP